MMHNKPLQTTRISSVADLAPYLDEWRAVAAGAPMRSPEWLLVWWRFYAKPDDELCVLLCHEEGGTLVGLAPLYLEIKGDRRTVRLLGSGDASTNHTTWLAAAGWEERISSAVTAFLLDLKPAWHSICFESVDADDPAINATAQQLQEKGLLVQRAPRHNCWSVALPPTWDGYLKTLSPSRRKRCRGMQRQYLDSGLVQLHRVTSETDFAKGFGILLELHSARWGEAAHPLGGFSDRRFREFHEAAARELLKRNRLLLVWLEYDGRPVAIEYQFIGPNTVYSYQAGMDPSVTDFPPGNLSIMASLQNAIAQGCASYDFSRGDQPYKSGWRAAPVACIDIRIWPDQFSGRIHCAGYALGNMAESGKMRIVKGVKSIVPPHAITLWRRLNSIMTGKRRGPRKTGGSK